MNAHKMIFAIRMILGLVVVALPQAAGTAWEALPLPDGALEQDTTQPANYGDATRPMLATDGSGRLYVSNGMKLHIGSRGGSTWTTLVKPHPSSVFRNRALAAGGTGTVQWGGWHSRDGGYTWDSTDGEWATAFSVLADGAILQGHHYDGIQLLNDAGAWKRVHSGSTYGFITRFVTNDTRVVLALPSYDALKCSLDSGKTWNWGRQAWPWEYNVTGRNIRALDFENALGSSILIAQKKNPDGSGNRLLRLAVFYPVLDSTTWAGAVLPDSAITALHVDGDGKVWLGTQGQGVWSAVKGGRIFSPCNEGLVNLYVTDLVAGQDGELFVMTRDGIYRPRQAATVIRLAPAKQLPQNPAGVSLHLPGYSRGLPPLLMRSPAQRNVLIDGRTVRSMNRTLNEAPILPTDNP